MLIIYNLLQTIGYYGFASWVPTLLVSQGIEVTKSLAYTFIIAIAAPIGPLVGVVFADRFERKWQIAWAAIGIAVFGIFFARQATAIGVIAFGVLITMCNNWMSFAFHAYQAELYPTRIRAKAVGFVYSWSRFSAIFSGFIIAFFLGRYGTMGVFGTHRGRHDGGRRRHRRFRARRHQAPPRSDRALKRRLSTPSCSISPEPVTYQRSLTKDFPARRSASQVGDQDRRERPEIGGRNIADGMARFR